MCGRYLFTSPPEAVANAFKLDVRENFPPRWNIAPTQPIGIIRRGETSREKEFALVRWGFIPSWAKKDYHERMGSKPLINARSETVAEKPTFRAAFKRRRCLVPADGFYEWKSEKGGKQPYCIQPSEGGLFAFAGIWETAHDPDGGEIDTAAILTVGASEDLKPLHHREPIVIQPKEFSAWLEPDETKLEDVVPLLRPAADGYWRYFEVSKAVNNARNEGEALASEIGQQELF
ncbi:MAG: SOS response-associated peptidase [Pseudomonadota bacterium]